MALTITSTGAACGGVVTGVALAELSDSQFATIHEAWLEHLVLFFPGQGLSPAQQRDFGARFGELEIHPLTEKLDGVDEVTVLHSERGGRADVWHTDVTFNEEPPIAAVLQQISGPTVGGDTMWSNQYLAFESMSEPMKEFLRSLTAIHSAWPQGRPDLRAERPVITVHPDTGRESLAVNRLFTVRIPQLDPAESDAMLAHLSAWGERPEFQCRWHWTPGDIAIWDNRCTRHYAIGDYESERIMHRVTVIGPYSRPSDIDPVPHHRSTKLSASTAFHMR